MARGGEGKTTLVNHWLGEMAADDFRGAERVFARSFYSQGTSERAASADKVIDEALRFFGEKHPERLSSYDRGRELAERVGAGRNILILDGMEPLQYPPGEMEGEIKAPALEVLLKTLLFHNRGLCIVTTREEIRPVQGSKNHEEIILRRLTRAAAGQLLRKLGVYGDKQAVERAIEENQGHALAITLLGTYLVGRFDGDVANITRVTYPAGYEDDSQPSIQSTELLKGRERESKHARKMIGSYEKWFDEEPDEVNSAALVILRFMGLFNRPPESGCIAALRKEPIEGLSEALFASDDPGETWRKAIIRLERARLLERPGNDWNDIDCHPLIREYFAEQLADTMALRGHRDVEVGETGDPGGPHDLPAAAREAHRRLYEHLKQSADHRPNSLSGLQPLYMAVRHGCLAGFVDDAIDNVFSARILRRGDFSWKHLGTVGSDLFALACFYQECWSTLRPGLTPYWKAFVLAQSGFLLRNLGRLDQAAEPLKLGLAAGLTANNLTGAAIAAGNLAELHSLRGELGDALKVTQHAVQIAKKIGGFLPYWSAASRLAHVLFQNGRIQESEELFLELEDLNNRRHGAHPDLHSMPGFWYCQLLLSRVERIAYGIDDRPDCSNATNLCREIRERACNALAWSKDQPSLLDEALDRLSLGRLAVLEHLVESRLTGDGKSAGKDLVFRHFEEAVNGLRRANQVWLLPYALLGRAEYCFVTGEDASQEGDLNEVEQLVQRFGMKLFLADAILLRGRIALKKGDIPAVRSLAAEAECLVQRTGYNRRKAEVTALKQMTETE